MPGSDLYDITIIGAGPAGLLAAFSAGMRQMKAKVIERLPEPGGQLVVLYPDKYIYDAPGHSKILAKDLVAELYKQSRTFAEPTFCFEEHARLLQRQDERFILKTDRGEHHTRTVLIAAGIGAFSPHKLNAPGVEDDKPGIHYYVKDSSRFRGHNVLIVGGGDSAADWALAVAEVAKKVTLIHRRDQFRAHESSVARLTQLSVEVRTFHELKHVYGERCVEGVRIYDNRTGREEDLPADDVIIAIGFKADLGEIRYWNLSMDEQLRHIRVNPRMETNIPGVYAAGDVTELAYLEKLDLPEPRRVYGGARISLPSPKYEEIQERWGLIVIGYAQATMAVNHARQYVSPEAKLAPAHSSDMRASS